MTRSRPSRGVCSLLVKATLPLVATRRPLRTTDRSVSDTRVCPRFLCSMRPGRRALPGPSPHRRLALCGFRILGSERRPGGASPSPSLPQNLTLNGFSFLLS